LARGSLALWSAALALAPAPALAVMLIFAERFPDEPVETEALRLFLGVVVCYGAVWLAVLAGWLARRMTPAAG